MMESGDQPAPDWQAQLRQKSDEELLRLLHDAIGDEAKESFAEEIRQVFLERKAKFTEEPEVISGPLLPSWLVTVLGIIGILTLNFLILGPLIGGFIAEALVEVWPVSGGPGEGISMVPSLGGTVALTALIMGGIDATLFFATKKSPRFKPFMVGFFVVFWIWGALLGLSLAILVLFLLLLLM